MSLCKEGVNSLIKKGGSKQFYWKWGNNTKVGGLRSILVDVGLNINGW